MAVPAIRCDDGALAWRPAATPPIHVAIGPANRVLPIRARADARIVVRRTAIREVCRAPEFIAVAPPAARKPWVALLSNNTSAN
jgi:hypothetical protein